MGFVGKRSREKQKGSLITYSNADSVISDQFRAIRTNIRFLPGNKKNRIILITSPMKGEGKSTTVANLAVSMAQEKEKVLLIDAHIGNPVIHRMFKIPNQHGLTDMLTNGASLDKVIYSTAIGKLDIITSGSMIDNPAELLGSEKMTKLLHKVVEMYPIVLIDSPAVLKSTGTRMLANQCDGVVLVIHRGKTKMAKIAEARKLLELAHAQLVGAIINEK